MRDIDSQIARLIGDIRDTRKRLAYCIDQIAKLDVRIKEAKKRASRNGGLHRDRLVLDGLNLDRMFDGNEVMRLQNRISRMEQEIRDIRGQQKLEDYESAVQAGPWC